MKLVHLSSVALGLVGLFLIVLSLCTSYLQPETSKAELSERRRLEKAIKDNEALQQKEDAERKNGAETRPVLEYIIAQPQR